MRNRLLGYLHCRLPNTLSSHPPQINEQTKLEVPNYMSNLWGEDWGSQTPAKVVEGLNDVLDLKKLRQEITNMTGEPLAAQ